MSAPEEKISAGRRAALRAVFEDIDSNITINRSPADIRGPAHAKTRLIEHVFGWRIHG
jgi:hypothetical protein